MATKPKDLSALQRDLLQLAVQGPKARIWLPKASQQSFPTTYSAVVSLQRRGLLEPEQGKDPDVLTWKLTKEGREALKVPKAEPAPVKAAEPQRVVPPLSKAPVRPAASGSSSGAAPTPEPRTRNAKVKELAAPTPSRRRSSDKVSSPALAPKKATAAPVPAAAPSRSVRSASPAKAEAPRERGSKGKTAVPPASSTRDAGKKSVSAKKKSGGRGRT